MHAAPAGSLTAVTRRQVGRIEDFAQPFDVAVAVHACGLATDYAQLQAIRASAPFVLALPGLDARPAPTRTAG